MANVSDEEGERGRGKGGGEEEIVLYYLRAVIHFFLGGGEGKAAGVGWGGIFSTCRSVIHF